jgi:hypothetical protein
METLRGGCACGNIRFEIVLSQALSTYHPRACDCDFCVKHGAGYISDPNGSLHIQVRNPHLLQHYRQGTRLASFLVCKHCGILTNVLWQNNKGEQFGSVNSRTVEQTSFAEPQVISVQHHTPEETIQRWETHWFPNVVID